MTNRDKQGRFIKGNPGGPGRPRGKVQSPADFGAFAMSADDLAAFAMSADDLMEELAKHPVKCPKCGHRFRA